MIFFLLIRSIQAETWSKYETKTYPAIEINSKGDTTCIIEETTSLSPPIIWAPLANFVIKKEQTFYVNQNQPNAMAVFHRVTLEIKGFPSPSSDNQVRARKLPGITINGLINKNYIIQKNTDVSNPEGWITIANVTITNSPYVFIDYNQTDTINISYRAKIVDWDPVSMSYIPQRDFQMGDGEKPAMANATPVHIVTLTDYYIEKHEVTKGLWDEVYSWAKNNGYNIGNTGNGLTPNHPVTDVAWFDAIAWCNARSEREKRKPVYYYGTYGGGKYVLRSSQGGQLELIEIDSQSNGYRLPTEAEWECAARGGTTTRFYTGSCLSSTEANYDAGYPDSGCARNEIFRGSAIPVGSLAPNPFGLFDMAGNVAEWTWDWYGVYSSASVKNPAGPSSGEYRVVRGGSYADRAAEVRSAYRNIMPPQGKSPNIGFRCVISNVSN